VGNLAPATIFFPFLSHVIPSRTSNRAEIPLLSVWATTWAYEQTVKPVGRKFVLVCLANYADEKGYCFPSQQTLASMTDQGVSTVREHLKALESDGLIVREHRYSQKDGGGRTSDGFHLQAPENHLKPRPLNEKSIQPKVGVKSKRLTAKKAGTYRQVSADLPPKAGDDPSGDPLEEPSVGAQAQPEPQTLSGIPLLRDVAKAYPPKESWERYLEILGENPDESKLRKCRAEWVDRGYNKISWKWFTEWYVSGIPERNGNGKSGSTARTYEWQGRYYALDEVISDDGQRYTIMGPDGTPSKRWHSLEAFAADKGITLEQAKYGMGAR